MKSNVCFEHNRFHISSKHHKKMRDDYKLCKMYCDGALQSDIAKELKVSTGQVSLRIKNLRLPKRGKSKGKPIPLNEEQRSLTLQKFKCFECH